MLLNNYCVNEEIKGEIKNIPKYKWKWNYDIPNSMGCSKNDTKKEVNSNTGLPQEKEKSQINN